MILQPAIPQVVYPRPDPVKLEKLEWDVLVRDSAYMCLSPDGYESLSKNMAELVRYMKDLQAWGATYEQERIDSNAKRTP